MARVIINYYEVGKTIRFSNGLKVQVVKSEKNEMCKNCAFGHEEFIRAFSGRPESQGYSCSLTVSGHTNCSAREREDKNNITYKKL